MPFACVTEMSPPSTMVGGRKLVPVLSKIPKSANASVSPMEEPNSMRPNRVDTKNPRFEAAASALIVPVMVKFFGVASLSTKSNVTSLCRTRLPSKVIVPSKLLSLSTMMLTLFPLSEPRIIVVAVTSKSPNARPLWPISSANVAVPVATNSTARTAESASSKTLELNVISAPVKVTSAPIATSVSNARLPVVVRFAATVIELMELLGFPAPTSTLKVPLSRSSALVWKLTKSSSPTSLSPTIVRLASKLESSPSTLSVSTPLPVDRSTRSVPVGLVKTTDSPRVESMNDSPSSASVSSDNVTISADPLNSNVRLVAVEVSMIGSSPV